MCMRACCNPCTRFYASFSSQRTKQQTEHDITALLLLLRFPLYFPLCELSTQPKMNFIIYKMAQLLIHDSSWLVQSDKILLESSSTCVENDWRAFTAHIWTVNIYLREINITIIIITNDYICWNYIQDIALILSNVIAHCAHFLFEICRPKWNSGSSSGCFQLLCIFNKLGSFTFAVAASI